MGKLLLMAILFLVSYSAWADAVSLEQAYRVLTTAQAISEPREKPSGIEGRLMSGYQGWFRAEGDGAELGFQHYQKNGKFEPGSCSIDLWPDLSEFEDDEKYPTAFRHSDGSIAHVFSSLHEKTVNRHFRWMKDYELDGVFVQRFATIAAMESRNYRRLMVDNEKLLHCRAAANEQKRCYALMYDLSGLTDDDFERLARDWKNLRTKMQLGTDPNDQAYLQHKGKPLVAIWGIGFNDDREYSLEKAADFLRLLKHNPEWGGASLMLGVPYGWREKNRDTSQDESFHKVLELADIISPWSVGRYHMKDLRAGSVVQHQIADREWCDRKKVCYLPVVYPGFSWKNLNGGELGSIPREGGKFLWEQFLATRAAGNNSAYVAMFDEIDEGTAIFKCSNNPPVGKSKFLTYEGLPSDHYLWLCKKGKHLLNGKTPIRNR